MEKQIFGPLELPSGKKIKFREPVGQDRVNVVQMLKMSMDNFGSGAVLVDGYVAVKCITEINDLAPNDSYKNVYDSLPDEDLSFYQAVFTELFGMTEEKRDKAKEAASFLRRGQTYTASSNVQNMATQPITKDG